MSSSAPTSTAIPFAMATLGIASFSTMDVVMKGLSISLGAYNAMLWRMLAGIVLGGAGAAAVLYAYNLVLQRQQAQVASPIEIVFFQNLTAGSVLLLGSPWLAVIPELSHAPAIVGSTVLAIIALLLLSWAYARAEAQVLVPVEYTAFVWAALFGWYFYHEAVTAATLVGTGLIVAGCVIATRQKPQARPEHVEAVAL